MDENLQPGCSETSPAKIYIPEGRVFMPEKKL
jgi:hypothetical protein